MYSWAMPQNSIEAFNPTTQKAKSRTLRRPKLEASSTSSTLAGAFSAAFASTASSRLLLLAGFSAALFGASSFGSGAFVWSILITRMPMQKIKAPISHQRPTLFRSFTCCTLGPRGRTAILRFAFATASLSRGWMYASGMTGPSTSEAMYGTVSL